MRNAQHIGRKPQRHGALHPCKAAGGVCLNGQRQKYLFGNGDVAGSEERHIRQNGCFAFEFPGGYHAQEHPRAFALLFKRRAELVKELAVAHIPRHQPYCERAKLRRTKPLIRAALLCGHLKKPRHGA